jgi:hypothetical protein
MMREIRDNEKAVTELMGTMFLLAIAVCVISVIMITVVSSFTDTADVQVDILGKIQGNNVVLEHQGGENLGLDTEVFLEIGGYEEEFTAGDYLDEKSKFDGFWSIGEQVIYPSSLFDDIEELMVNARVIDPSTKSMILYGLLKDGGIILFKGAIWHFDEGSGYVAIDSSGNGNDGTIVDGKYDENESVHDSSLYFDEVDDHIIVNNSYSLTMTENISIEAWINPLGTIASIDEYIFDGAFAYNPDAIHIFENIFGVAYIDSGNDVMFRTFVIESDGDIDETGWIDEVDLSTMDTNACNEPDLIHIYDDVYGVAYASENHGSGWIKTFRVNDSGYVFDDLVNNKLLFETSECFTPNITHVSGDIYAIAYEGKASGVVITINITSDGRINGGIIDSFVFDTNTIKKNKIIHVNGDIFAITYINKNNDLIVNTIEILSTGDISDIMSQVLDINQCSDPDIVHVSGDVYAISYGADMTSQGNVVSFEIDSFGSISGVIDTLIFENTVCEDPDIIYVESEYSDNYYTIAYASTTPHVGHIVTVEILPNGLISDNISYEFTYNDHHGYEPEILPVFGESGVYLVIYRGFSPHVGYISTTLTVKNPTHPIHRGIVKEEVFAIYADETNLYGSINDVTLSAPIDAGEWSYVALTYDNNMIRLYLNGVMVNSTPYSEPINQNSNPVIIGYLFHGYIDEVAIYETVLTDTEILEHYLMY